MFLTKWNLRDLAAVGAVLLMAALLICLPLLWKEEGEILVITTPDGSEEYALSGDREIPVTSRGITLTVTIREGAAYVSSSTCPDHACMSTTLREGGDTAVCAPAGVRLLIKGGDGDVDFVAG